MIATGGAAAQAGVRGRAWTAASAGVGEGHVLIQLRQRQGDPELGQDQGGVPDQDIHDPVVTRTGEDRGGDAGLFQDDVPPDGRRGAVFAVFSDAVGGGGGGLITSNTTVGSVTTWVPGGIGAQTTIASG
jgi:hypothetical protein